MVYFFTVGEVQYVEMFETPDGKSRGSGYVCFFLPYLCKYYFPYQVSIVLK